jgi:hypothetical protein
VDLIAIGKNTKQPPGDILKTRRSVRHHSGTDQGRLRAGSDGERLPSTFGRQNDLSGQICRSVSVAEEQVFTVLYSGAKPPVEIDDEPAAV